MNAATRTALTTVSTAVEVQVTDFSTPGMPSVWVAGVVETVRPMGRPEQGLTDVVIRCADGRLATRIIGKRGGGAATLRLA